MPSTTELPRRIPGPDHLAQDACFAIFTRVTPTDHPGTPGHPHQPGLWPNRWIEPPASQTLPLVAAYRLEFTLRAPATIRVHLTGDERYEFFVDGQTVTAGPERGDTEHWFFESYDLHLSGGSHTFVARVWSLGDKAPVAQIGLRPGFFLSADEPCYQKSLGTGSAPWEVKILGGYEWRPPATGTIATGWNQTIHGSAFDWSHEKGEGTGWKPARTGPFGDSAEAVRHVALQDSSAPHHRLLPAMLPAMIDETRRIGAIRHISTFSSRPVGLTPLATADDLPAEHVPWQGLLTRSRPLRIPAFTTRRIIIDLEDYYCARPVLTVSGGNRATIEIDWSEALYEHIDLPGGSADIEAHIWPKGHRDRIVGKFFICPWSRQDGPGNIFHPDGGSHRTTSTLWWQAGRYIQILVETRDDPLKIEDFHLRETRYPLEMEGRFDCSDPQLNAMIPTMVRGLQMCAHETYMDCPYYEQLMYAGDTRLELLTTYTLTADDRLARKALKLFDWSRLSSGLTQSRYPAKVRQVIPPFSLWWVASCHDYALWRGEPSFTKSLLPGIRAVCEHFAGLIREDGLITAPDGWNFTDWTKSWPIGVPPEAQTGFSSVLNWQAALVFRQAAELEAWFGEPELSALQTRRARTVAAAAHRVFWNDELGLYADEPGHLHWSEHAQCLAILSGFVPAPCLERLADTLLTARDLAPTTIYFSHYLFEAYRKIGRIDAFLTRLELWHSLKDLGLKTPIESPEPSRSDCHAWGSHPLYHFYATLAGIRPTSPGFTTVEIKPQTGPLHSLQATLPHPRGMIRVQIENGELTYDLPPGVALEREKLKGKMEPSEAR